MINEDIANSMLAEFDGCDSDNPGSPDSRAVWLFGIEPGKKGKKPEITEDDAIVSKDDSYSINTQLGYRFNQKAFKLLAAMYGYPVDRFREFAYDHQPFVRGQKDKLKGDLFFKGNLYPYACHNVDEWPEDAIKETGLSDKDEYRKWCRESRLPAIKRWVDKYRPAIFIGVGITCRHEFALAVFGKEVPFKEERFIINTHIKSIFHFIEGSMKLVVVPHFAGPHGLNSNKSLQEVGLLIGEIKRRPE